MSCGEFSHICIETAERIELQFDGWTYGTP